MFRSHTHRIIAALTAAVILSACGDYGSDPYTDPSAPPQPAVVSATGDITTKVGEFRTLLGDPANGAAPGEQPAGRREIAWDGAGANAFNNRDDFPASFFNTNVKNGAVFTTPGTGFRNDSLKFAEVNAAYAAQFGTFSPTKIFAPVGSNVMDVLFQVAGQPTPAQVSGFGVVFSDVDVAGSTTIELFDRLGQSLGRAIAPTRSDAAGLSFVGVKFDQAIIARARLTLGSGALGAAVNDVSAGGALDLVVADNFIYGEPHAIP